MLTIRDNCHSRRFIDYIEPMVDHMSYYHWKGGVIPSGGGAFAYNGPAPAHSYLRAHPYIFCAAVPTLALRLAGKRIPIAQRQSEEYDGGIAAYFGSPALPQIGAGYFQGYSEPFNETIALKWARDTRQMVLLGTPYRGVHLGQQGHAALLLPSGYLLQSIPGEGLNWTYTLKYSNRGGYWNPSNGGTMTHPSQWLEYKGDKVHRGGIWK